MPELMNFKIILVAAEDNKKCNKEMTWPVQFPKEEQGKSNELGESRTEIGGRMERITKIR
jgi:hypothetical protein